MKLELIMLIKIFMRIKIHLVLVIIHQIQIFFNLVNKKVIGKTKDEFKRKIIIEFGRLKSKMYSSVSVDGTEIKKAKGVNKNVMKSTRHKRIC